MSPDRPPISVVAAVAVAGDRCLVAKRGPGGSAAFQWEFPGGKVKAGESEAQALAREIREELDLRILVCEKIGSVRAHAATTPIELTLYRVEILSGTPVLHEHSEVRWIRAEELRALDFAAADRPLIARVEDLLRVTA